MGISNATADAADDDRREVLGLPGHWHQTLDLPCGYQHFNWYKEGVNENEIYLNDLPGMRAALEDDVEAEAYLYTHHEVFLEGGIIKHTRSSPNWEGGLVTYSTCKHLMRTYRDHWRGVWLVGLCPKECADNALLFAGRIHQQFESNYHLSRYVSKEFPLAHPVKRASTNPRGDLYTPRKVLQDDQVYTHGRYLEPPSHTRSLEFYKKSPGSTNDRPDGKVPKWWRDVEYLYNGRRPPCFILRPCYLFSRPVAWHTLQPRRATMRTTAGAIAEGLMGTRA